MIVAEGNAGVTIEFGPIDLDMLNDQYKELINLIWDDTDNILWGVVEMIGDILYESKL